jgi:hypothetical protein
MVDTSGHIRPATEDSQNALYPSTIGSSVQKDLRRIYRLQPWEEAVGILQEIQEYEGYCLAKIGPVTVSLPDEIILRLRELKGNRIGVIRCDNGYRVRLITERQKHD